MGQVVTSKVVQHLQLQRELGGVDVRYEPDPVPPHDLTIIVPDLEDAAIQAVVDAHVPVDEEANRSTLEQNVLTALTQLQTSVDGLTLIIGKTNAEIGPADIKDIARAARQNAQALKKVIRLVARKLDGTD